MDESWFKKRKLFACLLVVIGVVVISLFSLLPITDQWPIMVFPGATLLGGVKWGTAPQGAPAPRPKAWNSAVQEQAWNSAVQGLECRSDLPRLLTGRWEQRITSAEDVRTMKAFLKQYQDVQLSTGIPKGLERDDKRCGNVTLKQKPGNKQYDLGPRAVCDAEGPTPCCFHNVCLNKTVEECACANCIDPRTLMHAEYALWRPKDPHCLPLAFSQRELCDLLDNGTIYFIGDSLVRHVHTAMLLMIRNDDRTGAFSDDIPQELRDKCEGLNMFTEKVCKNHVAFQIKACDDRVQIRFIWAPFIHDGSRTQGEILQLKNRPKSLVFIGLGIYNTLNTNETFRQVIKPVLDVMSAEHRTWPVIVWASIHSFGMLYNPHLLPQNKDVIRFNREMNALLAPYKESVPLHIFDAYDMTTAVSSHDGTHYGMGVNKVKVNILMNFIDSMKRRRLW